MPSIELKDVRKVFPVVGGSGQVSEIVALDTLSVRLDAGDRLGIVGPNGAGKSTLLHLIAGVSSPNSGSIVVDGQVTSILTLGLAFREDLTGRENIYLDGEMQGKSRTETDRYMEAIIEFAELGEFVDLPVRTYSTGMKSRLMFAMISHLNPEILLIDEALSAGDHIFAAKATQRIRDICARGRIVVLVSHSSASIVDICNRCIWIDRGRLVMEGAPEEVTRCYEDSVKNADERAGLVEFVSRVGDGSLRSGYAIRKLTLRRADGEGAGGTLATGEDVLVDLVCEVPVGGPEVWIRLSVERADGLSVIDEACRLSVGGESASGCLRVSIELPGLPLGYGEYQVKGELLVDGRRTAWHSALFEVGTRNPVTGGRPVLVYPYRIEVG